MSKTRVFFLSLLMLPLWLTGCSQEKVIDTEFVRLKNHVDEIDLALKRREEEAIRLNQKITNLEETVNRQKEQISQLIAASPTASLEKHPVIIQDVKITSENMDANGRVWGPYDLNITLYNGTNRPVADSVSALILTEDPTGGGKPPNVEQVVKKFKLEPHESKIVSLVDLPVNDPSKRINIIVKLLESAASPDREGVLGKATWTVVPTVIYPPDPS